MITEFQQHLTDLLSARLAAPFTGRALVAPGTAMDDNADLVVGVQQVDLLEPDFGSRRPEVVPGAGDPRRVLRLQCTLSVVCRPGKEEGRDEQLRGLESALYVLDAPDFRDGSALVQAGDPGFFIQESRVGSSTIPIEPEDADAPPVSLGLTATGWFWPVGQPGQAGVQIGEVRIRGSVLPIDVLPANPRPVAGGPPLLLVVQVRTLGLLRAHGPGEALPALPFGNLAAAVFAAGRRPPAGSLSGGADGTGGVRLLTLTDGAAELSYIPPPEAASEELVIALEDGAGGAGVELAHMALEVKES